MNDNQLLSRLTEANAYRDDAALPDVIWTRELAIREIERRIGMDRREVAETTEVPSGRRPKAARRSRLADVERPAPRWRKPALVGAAVLAAVVVVGAVLALAGLLGDENDVVDFSDPQSFAEEFVDTYNDGDIDRIMTFFTPDAYFELEVGSAGPDLAPEVFEAWHTFYSAAGDRWTIRECTLVEASAIRCVIETQTEVWASVGFEPAIHDITMVLTPEGVSSYFALFEQAPHMEISPLIPYLMANDRDGLRALRCCHTLVDGVTTAIPVEDARLAGEVDKRSWEGWADYLDVSGCAADDFECQAESY